MHIRSFNKVVTKKKVAARSSDHVCRGCGGARTQFAAHKACGVYCKEYVLHSQPQDQHTHTHTLTHSSVLRGTYTNQETNIIHPLWAELRQVPALNLAVMSGSLISSAAADGGRRGSECVFIKGAEEQADRVSHKSPLLCWGSKREEVNVEV